MRSLLITEKPLMFYSNLAVAIGLNKAIMLQKVEFCLHENLNILTDDYGNKWVTLMLHEMREYFPFWSDDTIRRTMKALQESGYIRCQLWRERKYYGTVDHYLTTEFLKIDI